jgi:hypothetical protein
MALNKSKKSLVWCCEKPIQVENHFGERRGSRIVNRHGFDYVIPSSIRCPNCGKAFKPRVRECMDQNCWHIDVPAHKKTETKRD